MGWNKNNRPEPQAATSADDSRKTATLLPCGKCGVWVPVAVFLPYHCLIHPFLLR